ncbi:MAG: lytic transglycosylase domain-containing protein [Candidatus Caenarcaniphilales bacterium]|nr:lytic transglycosylase domain-containing protein [Candidatus Caenarcaniphilales bacterium]
MNKSRNLRIKNISSKATFVASIAILGLCFVTLFFVNQQKLRDIYLLASYQVCPVNVEQQSKFSLSSELDKIEYIDSNTKKNIEKAINRASIKTGLSQKLILLLIKQESAFRPYVVSPVGAKGLTQLMPSTALYFCNLNVKDIFGVEKNVLCGSSYLRELISEFDGDIELALAAYNSGPNRIREIQKKYNKFGNFNAIKNFVPKETKHYVSEIGKYYRKVV